MIPIKSSLSGKAWNFSDLSHRAFLFLFLFTAAMTGLYMVDTMLAEPGYVPGGRATGKSGGTGIHHQGSGRMFVLFFDSLRYQTAMNPAIMPHLGRLLKESVFARTRPCVDTVTVPCVRAAFTGRDHFQLSGILSNFLRGRDSCESLFSQAREHGRKTACFSIHAFLQFGDAVQEHYPSVTTRTHMLEENLAAAQKALDLFIHGPHDLVVLKIDFTNEVAHKVDVDDPLYHRYFRAADRLVQTLSERLPRDATFAVLGDHGHDERGRYCIGMDVPTLSVYRGPGFRRNIDLGTIDLMDNRYFMSWALKLPLKRDAYSGGSFPEALVWTGDLHPSYDPAGRGVPEQEGLKARQGRFICWVFLSLIAALWFNQAARAHSPLGIKGAREWLLFLVFLPLALNPPFQIPTASILAGTVFLYRLRGLGPGPLVTWGLLPPAAFLGFHFWGRALTAWRGYVHEPSLLTIGLCWLIPCLALFPVVRRSTRMRITWVFGGVSGFLLYPTTYVYGFVGILTPLFLCWLSFYAVSLLKSHDRTGAKDGPQRASFMEGAALFLAMFLIIQGYLGIESSSFCWDHWSPIIDFMRVTTLPYLAALALLSKAILFFMGTGPLLESRRNASDILLNLAVIALLTLLQWHTLEPTPWQWMGLTALCAALWVFLRRRAAQSAALSMGLCLLFLLYYYSVRTPMEQYAWNDCFLALMVLASRFVRRFPQQENLSQDYGFLLLTAVLMTGFVTSTWTIRDLEWQVLYDWIEPYTVEHNVFLFLPWIIVKTVLPLFIFRMVLRRGMGRDVTFSRDLVLMAAGAKLLSLVLVTTGIGVAEPGTYIYIEAVQQIAVLTMITFGLVL